jgi:tyrosinase
MPYWDWAKAPPSGQTNTPAAIRDQTVTVTKPSGKVSIPNPLYSYTWGTSLPAEMGGGPYGNSVTTLRRPVANPSRSNNNELNSRMNSLRVSLRDRVYGIFMSGASWGSVSTSAIGVRIAQNGNSPDSFESIHDAVHSTTGGETGGHMYYLDYSSFDPIFWLHHTNIDRLLAMYQVVSPNTYMSNGNVNRPMAQWNRGEAKNQYSPLKPFTKNSAGDYYTSVDVKNTRVLGYVYPETNGSPTAASVRAAVAKLYGPNTSNKKRSTSTGQYEGRPAKEGDYHTVLSIMANKYVMDGSYTVHCFLGDVNAGNSTSNVTVPYPTNSTSPFSNSTSPYSNSTTDFTESPNYVGAYGVLGGSMGTGPNSTTPVITEGCIPLTTALQGKEATGELKSLHPDDVESYLKDNLHYKVIGPGGVELEADKIDGFHVYAKSCKLSPPSSPEELPSLGEYVVIPKATENKPAGKPFVYTPAPIDVFPPTPPTNEEPTGVSPAYPTGTILFPGYTAPEEESGYCVSQQTIEYVDENGKFLYSEKA